MHYNFNEIYNEYFNKIVQHVSRIAGETDAEDITQDVFCKLSRNLGDFQGKSKLSTWIYRIATNAAIDKLRSAAYKHSSKSADIDDTSDIADCNTWTFQPSPDIDQTVIRREMSECVVEFIDKLPQNYRTMIVLSELEGLTNREIADILNISMNNVKIRLHRARAKLREALHAGCDFYRDDRNILACDRKPQISPKTPK